MDVPLIRMIADRLAASGVPSLRFDFRGVGGSAGRFTDGEMETADLGAAVSWLQSGDRANSRRVALAGWSFGAWVALSAVAGGLTVEKVVAVAPPLAAYRWKESAAKLASKGAELRYVVGGSDQFCPAESLREFALSAGGSRRDVSVLPGVDHFLRGSEDEVASLVARSILGR